MKRTTRPNLAARFAAVSLGTALLLSSAGAAMAQSTSTTATTTKSASSSARGAAKSAEKTAEMTALAGRLGVSVEKLQQALSDQATADHAKKTAERQANQSNTTRTRKSATETQALADARATELAGRLGVTKDTLVNAVKAQAKAKVDADLAAGYITAAQATAKKAMIDANPGMGIGGGKGGMHGGKGGMHGGGKGGGRGGRH